MDKYIGKRLDGRYEIREIIGVGGMAYVYKAYDTIDDRIVAVKILKDEFLANEEFTRRFKNESKAIAILSHPNIVKVYDVSFGERMQYIVMEYIDGITLKEYIEQQKDIKWKEAVHFTVQILRALQHAHDKGIVHRDIKPQNIMLLPDGTIKVTDFGIARFARGDVKATGAADKAIGSVHYISPEQARGDITDEKADIYSVGVMLYEMLTGRLPFEADNAVSVAIMQMQAEPTKPSEINPDIPDGLEEITLKAMQKDPAKRYQTAAEMLYDIDEFKRNPSIHFEYKYFVDETPTRFVEAITRVKGNESEDEEEKSEGEEDEEERKGPPVIPILAAVAGAFVLVALLFVGAVALLGIFNDDKTQDVELPDFVGQDYTEIMKNKEYAENFKFRIVQTSSETVPKNQIIEQDPKGPKTVKQHTEVKLTVSLGPQMVDVPLIGNNEKAEIVRGRLEEMDFVVQEIPQASDEVPEGCVIKLTPSPGEKVVKRSTVTMYVSTGKDQPAENTVPNVENNSLATAKDTLSAAGFVVNDADIVYQNHDTYPKDYVIRQDPAKDTVLATGQAVKLVVSSGFKDVKDILVLLPNTDTEIDVQVYIDGVLEASESKQNILPKVFGSYTITTTAQKAEYDVTIRIKASSESTYKDYLRYKANGNTGKSTRVGSWPFDDPAKRTSPPTTTTAPTDAEPTRLHED